MGERKHYETAPEDRVPFFLKVVYGLGAFTNNLLAAAMGGMSIVLNLGLGIAPGMVGLLGALPRITDAITDPLMGYISDHTRSRWGRRRPYIFIGAILSGILFIALWQLPEGQTDAYYFWYFLVGSILFYLAYTMFATPWVALGYELTPDYHERTRLMGTQNFIGQLAYVVAPWFLWIMSNKDWFDDQVTGARVLAVIIAVVVIAVGILPAIFLRERFADRPEPETKPGDSVNGASPVPGKKTKKPGGLLASMKAFFKGFGKTLSSGPFLLLGAATFLVFNGFILISAFSSYVIIYYVCGGNQEVGSEWIGYAGSIGAACTFVVVVIVTWLATRIGKRRAFFVSTGISAVGYCLKWFCYNPEYPFLVLIPAPLMAFGLGGLFTLMPSMIADVVDLDEIKTHERREGMYGSIFWWVVKVGMALALWGGGVLLEVTGFDVELGSNQTDQALFLMRVFDVLFPAGASILAIWAVARYPITEERANEIRDVLEKRRGKAKVDIPDHPLLTPEHQARAEDILSRMNLEQKLGQMLQPERLHCSPADVKEHFIGSILSGAGSTPPNNRPEGWVAMNDAYWEASMDVPDGLPAVPLIYAVDAVHGHNNVLGAVVMPHNMGLGAANDPELIERIAQVTSREVLATGLTWTFAPMLAVARNQRWGRAHESYSEDPEIVVAYAERFVSALQQEVQGTRVLATAKHWVGDGGTTDGVDQGNTEIPLEELEAIHVAPYHGALDAGALTVMASYNSWNGKKCHGHPFLLQTLLKEKLGFRGFIVSDWNGTEQVADDFDEAVAVACNAGIDMFMVPEKWRDLLAALKVHVETGRIPMERIDDAVRRILQVKAASGLLDAPRPADRPMANHASFGSAEHRAVAREAARKSLVLLKNQNEVLPLHKEQKVLVAGRMANSRGHLCGGFTIEWQGVTSNELIEGGTSIWEGIQEAAPDAVLSEDGSAAESNEFDVAVVVIGEQPYAEFMGDIRADDQGQVGSTQLVRPEIASNAYAPTLEHAANHPEDLAVIQRIAGQGIPVVVVLVSGRCLVVNAELQHADAFVAAWLPGSEGGNGVADVLLGTHDFHGRLSFSWPRDIDDNYNRGDDDYNPLFPCGYGLKYEG